MGYVDKRELKAKGYLTLSEKTYRSTVDLGKNYKGINATGLPVILQARVYRGQEYYAQWCLPASHKPFYQMMPVSEYFALMGCPGHTQVAWDETSKTYQPV